MKFRRAQPFLPAPLATSFTFPKQPQPYRLVSLFAPVNTGSGAARVPVLELLDGGQNVIAQWCTEIMCGGNVTTDVTFCTGVSQSISAPQTATPVLTVPIPYDLIVLPQFSLRIRIDAGASGDQFGALLALMEDAPNVAGA